MDNMISWNESELHSRDGCVRLCSRQSLILRSPPKGKAEILLIPGLTPQFSSWENHTKQRQLRNEQQKKNLSKIITSHSWHNTKCRAAQSSSVAAILSCAHHPTHSPVIYFQRPAPDAEDAEIHYSYSSNL